MKTAYLASFSYISCCIFASYVSRRDAHINDISCCIFASYISHRDAHISEMSLELLLLQVVLPAFLEQGHARKWLKGFVQIWSNSVAYIL